jgi:predicted ATPase/class 3 adenylate cyclase
MGEQPTGTVTFLFSDIEGSTQLLRTLGASVYADALDQHRRLLRDAFVRYQGYEVDCEGDAFFVAFATADAAVAAAIAGQSALAAAGWPHKQPLRVRMGLHTGAPLAVPPKYVGLDVHKAARVMAAAHGGQVLISQTTRVLLDGQQVRDLGEHRLKDMGAPERIFQVGTGEFPPPKSLNLTNLPVAAGPLLGRTRELSELRTLLQDGARLMTLTGPGGTGKTRLALHAAAELVDDFEGGTFFVPLAQLRDASFVSGAISDVLGLIPGEDLFEAISSRRMLLLLDNAEHLADVELTVARLLDASPESRVLVTSRAPLRLSAEREYPVGALGREPAAELFAARAEANGVTVTPDETVQEICRRLDDLPLAIELAAARVKHLSPRALIERLDHVLPLLTSGPRDAPARQQTLRATIAWSYELLSPAASAAFRRAGVFRGGFTLNAAEAVCECDLDTIAALVDQSVLKRLEPDRFLMLETLREYALERLDDSDELAATRSRHADFYEAEIVAWEAMLCGPSQLEAIEQYTAEAANIWAALDHLLESGESERALELAAILVRFWESRNHAHDGRAWLERTLDHPSPDTSGRGRALAAAAYLATRDGDFAHGERLAHQGLKIARATGGGRGEMAALITLAVVRARQGAYEEAIELWEAARDTAVAIGATREAANAEHDLALCLLQVDRAEEAKLYLSSTLQRARDAKDELTEARASLNLAFADQILGRFAEAVAPTKNALRIFRKHNRDDATVAALNVLATGSLCVGDRHDALGSASEAVELGLQAGLRLELAESLELAALAYPDHGSVLASQLYRAVAAFRQEHGFPREPTVQRQLEPHIDRLLQHPDQLLSDDDLLNEPALDLNSAAELLLRRSPAPRRRGLDATS